MENIVLNKESANNLFAMLKSSDGDNKYIALKSIDQSNIEESLGFILVLFKFGRATSSEWETHSPNCWQKFNDMSLVDEKVTTVTASKIMRALIAEACDMDHVAMFIEQHSSELLDTLQAWGYPTELLEINVTLKEDVKEGGVTS
jgi:hypothetical protein